jgi:hypothetical protein
VRIALLSAVWRRLEIAPAWWSNVARIRDRFASHGHQLTAIVAGSEYGHKLICEEFGGLWVEVPQPPARGQVERGLRLGRRRIHPGPRLR